MDTPILIVGSGAMACLFAAKLAAADIPVILLGTWPEGLRALDEKGVQLVGPDGHDRIFRVKVTNDPNECIGFSYALVLVKSWQTGRVAGQLATCLPENGLAVTLQNGINNHQKLVDALGSERVGLGITTTGATLLHPGHVRQVGDGRISLGVHPRIGPLVEMLRTTGFNVDLLEDTDGLLWGKLIINAAINPLTALLHVQNGELLSRPSARSLMGNTARESASVAEGLGIDLPYPDVVVAVEAVAQRTAMNYSSMLQDVIRGAPTEIDSINGAIMSIGEAMGVPTPVNRTLWQLVKGMVQPLEELS
jgi:2-dehydropantoate 2-reductase